MKKNILIFCNQNQYVRIYQLVKLAKEIHYREPKFNFIFILPGNLPKFKDHIENNGFQTTFLDNPSGKLGTSLSKIKISHFFSSFIPFLKNNSLSEIVFYLRYKKIFERIVKKTTELLNFFHPITVFATGDREDVRGSAFLRAVKDRGSNIVIPYLTVSTADGPALLRKNNGIYRSSLCSPIITKYILHEFPGQIYDSKWGKMIFYRPSEIIVLNKYNALSKNPWFIGYGLSDIIVVDSRYTYQMYRKSGVPEKKLKIFGDLSFDALFNCCLNKNRIKQNTINKYSLNPKKKIAIIALPQFAEHHIMDWNSHWKEIKFIVSEVSKVFKNILISLHPKMERGKYVFLEKKYNCRILEERLYKVLSIADMFISTNSSTVGWAILCGIKTVTLDCYGLPKVFEDLSSIERIYDKNEFTNEMKRYLKQKVHFSHDWSILSRDEVFDGKVIDRYCSLLYHLSSRG